MRKRGSALRFKLMPVKMITNSGLYQGLEAGSDMRLMHFFQFFDISGFVSSVLRKFVSIFESSWVLCVVSVAWVILHYLFKVSAYVCYSYCLYMLI